MPKYKVVMHYPNGTSEELDEIFETESEAEDYGLESCGYYHEGAQILNWSNPGDYPLEDDDDVDYEVIEVDD